MKFILLILFAFFTQLTQAEDGTRTLPVLNSYYPMSVTKCSIVNTNGYISIVTQTAQCRQFKTYRYKKVPSKLLGFISYDKEIEDTSGEPPKYFYETQFDQMTFNVGLDPATNYNNERILRNSHDSVTSSRRVKLESLKYENIDATLKYELGKGLNMAAQLSQIDDTIREYRASSAQLRQAERNLSEEQGRFQLSLEQSFQNCIKFQTSFFESADKLKRHNQCK